MKNNLVAAAVGILFALGLGISGMTQPEKVFGFLDVFGNWDATLIFVMLGAVAVHFVAFRLIMKRKSPVFDNQWHVPTKKEITFPLVAGSFIFGIGWGLGGYCPGPALVSLASLGSRPVIFCASMVLGMGIFGLIKGKA